MTASPTYRTPSVSLVVREHNGKPSYSCKFRVDGKQVMRAVGPAWLSLDAETGKWVPRRGRTPDGYFDAKSAAIAAHGIVVAFVTGAEQADREARERQANGPTFRQVAAAYLTWLEDIKGAKPATLADHRAVLADPGSPARRGTGTMRGTVMAAIGDRPAAKVTTKHVGDLLASIAATRSPRTGKPVSARTVNKHRNVIAAAFAYGMRESSGLGLTANPAKATDKRRELNPGDLVYYSREEVEAIARAFENEPRAARDADPMLDAELVRVSAYAGLRLGELLALRWDDVKFADRKLIVRRAMSDGIETSTKSDKVREVALRQPAVAALDRISQREHFTSGGDLVAASRDGDHLDPSSLRRRYRRAQSAAGVSPLRWHDLRHTCASWLAEAGIDLVTIRDTMGHADLQTTGRYLHARSASVQAERFDRAFGDSPSDDTPAPVGDPVGVS